MGFVGFGAVKGRWISISFQYGCDGVGGRATFNARSGGAQSSQPFRIAGKSDYFWVGMDFVEGDQNALKKAYGRSCQFKFSPQSRLDALNPICACVKNQAAMKFMPIW